MADRREAAGRRYRVRFLTWGDEVLCPKCGVEYRPGFIECADCRVPLVQALVEAAPGLADSASAPVTVFESGDPNQVALARSILDSAGIPFVTKGEALQDLLGGGPLPGVINPAPGPVEFQVSRDDAEDARALLDVLRESARDQVEEGDDDEDG